MRYSASEKLEIIRLVEQSHLVSRCSLIATNKYRHDARWKHSAFPAPPSTAGMTASRRAVWKRWRIANRAPSGSGIAFQIPCGNGSILFACRDQQASQQFGSEPAGTQSTRTGRELCGKVGDGAGKGRRRIVAVSNRPHIQKGSIRHEYRYRCHLAPAG
jgi:hypothetical protein